MTTRARGICSMLLSSLVAVPAFAQRPVPSPLPADDWTHGTVVSASAGAATASSDYGPMVGAAVGWEVTPGVTIEGGGLWLTRPHDIDGFGAQMKLRVEPKGRPLSPFVEGGFGLFRLTAPGVAGLPDFYRRRMAANDAGLVSQSFTDPLLQAGCGLNVFASRHLAVQPVIEVLAVRGGGRTYAFAAASARVAWHFEDHPVTFGRR